MVKDRIKRNIPILFLIQAANWFLMIMPTIVLFFQNNGLSLFQVMVVQGVFAVTIVLFEIPSGFFSDKIGRRITLIIGLFINTLGLFIFAGCSGLWGFIIAEIFLGIGVSFISGTDSSLLYDTLIVLNEEDSHRKKEGLFISISSYSESLASILGGFVAIYSMRMNFFIEGIIMLLASVLALFIIEPDIKREGKGALKLRTFFSELLSIFSRKRIVYLVLFVSLSGLGTFLVLWYVQPEMARRGLPIGLFGLLWALLNLVVGISAHFSHKLPLKEKPFLLLAFFPFLMAISYFSLVFLEGLFILLGFLLFYIIRGLKSPLERNLIHREVSSSNRATVLSIQSMMMRLFFSIGGPLFALLATEKGNGLIYLSIGLFFLLLGLLNIVYLKFKRIPGYIDPVQS